MKYELRLYIGSLTTIWSSDAQELTTQAYGLPVNKKDQSNKLLLMRQYMTVFHILF